TLSADMCVKMLLKPLDLPAKIQPGAKRDGQAPKPKAAAKPRPQGGGNGNGARPSNGNAAHPNRNRSSRSGQRGH
ncbi:hypothetical protein QZL89_14025, partial [Burkholderia multivorans]|nr:hypothetical protein [Burkholderia multivorans]